MFKVIKKERRARRGEFRCAHGGTVQTPVFMNVGTQAAIKGGVSAIDLKERLGNNELVLHQCGIGKVNAAIGVTELIRLFNPDLVVSTGCAGGASDMLEVTDVVVSSQLAYHDVYCGCALGETVYGQVQGMPARYTTPREIVEKALACGERIHEGLIVTGDWFVDDREKMRSIIRLFPGPCQADLLDVERAGLGFSEPEGYEWPSGLEKYLDCPDYAVTVADVYGGPAHRVETLQFLCQ